MIWANPLGFNTIELITSALPLPRDNAMKIQTYFTVAICLSSFSLALATDPAPVKTLQLTPSAATLIGSRATQQLAVTANASDRTVAASWTRYRRAAKGGVPANRPSICSVLKSCPTSLLLYIGFSSSPLFISIHLVWMTFQPFLVAWDRGIFSYNILSLKYCTSLDLASLPFPASSFMPVRSSQANTEEFV
mgnify:CR=1 FL=1